MNNKEIFEQYKSKFEQALGEYSSMRQRFTDWQKQFEGGLEISGGEPAKLSYNFTKELIESQINVDIPQPLVTPRRPTDENMVLARTVEAMLRSELDRMPFESINDLEERISRVMGGALFLVEWDNAVISSDTVGALSVRLLSPLEFVPQPGVYDVTRMDYFFVVFEDTKERLFARYGISTDEESADARLFPLDSTSERVAQVICYFKNDSGSVGAVSWAGDTMLFCEEDYHRRKTLVCAVCGKAKSDERCVCGSTKFVKKDIYEELITENMRRSDGTFLPNFSLVRDDDGRVVLEGDMPVTEAATLPYYSIRNYPLALRKNTSALGRFVGGSDCEAIELLQREANKALTKIDEKLVNSGYIMTKPDSMQFELSNKMGKVLSVSGADQLEMMKAISFEFDATGDFTVLERCYEMAKSLLGVTDSFQGKADSTAVSGVAKELMIEQSAGIQRTKQRLKSAAYGELFRSMFEFMLSFADEPRIYGFIGEDGTCTEYCFNRYDFVKQKADGTLYYEDDFLFGVDESGAMFKDRNLMLEDIRTDLTLGAFGDPSEPSTMVLYWQEKEKLGYPNAGNMVRVWQERASLV